MTRPELNDEVSKAENFYSFPVYEFNLPAGHSCPYARACKIKVDRISGKFEMGFTEFRCYASSAERFPAVRESRWINFEAVKRGEKIQIPDDATHIRIHGSGDFFSQEYFDQWLKVCRDNPRVIFWAFTKSLSFWIKRISEIPNNLTLQASKGGSLDHLIPVYQLKFAQVFTDKALMLKSGLPLDYDDTLAMSGSQSFALLDNFKYSKKDQKIVK